MDLKKPNNTESNLIPKELIVRFNLSTAEKEIQSIAQSCIEGILSAEDISLGVSKVGGIPDVPSDFEWPYFKELPLDFLMQVNCKELESSVLPSNGYISYFYRSQYYADSLKDKGFIRVYYFPESEKLSEAAEPLEERKTFWGLYTSTIRPYRYSQQKLSFSTSISLPDLDYSDDTRFKRIESDDLLMEGYYELKAHYTEDRMVQIGGFPNPVQYDGIADSIAKLTGRGHGKDWEMILELNSAIKTDLMWGDLGRLHFFNHKEDTLDRTFDSAWMEYQCY